MTPDEVAAVTALVAITDPRADVSEVDLAHAAASPGRTDLLERADDGALIGWAFAEPIPGSADWAATVQVAPSARRHGVGERLLAAATRHAAAGGATGIEIESRSEEGNAFLARLGFVETGRELEVALDLGGATAEPTPAPPGVTIVRRVDRPGLEPGMYAVAQQAELDIPGGEERGPGTYAEFLAVNLDRPARRPELTFVALADDEVVGYAILHAGPRDVCYHGMTGVARAWRGRGIARALKQRQVAAARDAGFRLLVTENEARNAPIRRLNEEFGYVPYGETLFLRRGI
jgi:GNAT superfamily N-acetyltransferase